MVKDTRLDRAGVSGYNKPKRTPDHPTKSHVVAAKEGSQADKKFWSNREKAEGVGAKIVADRVKDTKLENDYSKSVGKSYKNYDQRESERREVQSYMERGSKETTGRKDYSFFKHAEKDNMKGKKK